MGKTALFWPSKNPVLSIPITLALGFTAGLFVDTSSLGNFILICTFLMIYPTMIGVKLKEAFDFSHAKVVGISLIINFLLIPLLAWGLGTTFLSGDPSMMAGLAIAGLLPTSGMTISWTMMFKGNVPAAIKMTALSLIIGSILAPFYLLIMVGKYVPIDLMKTFTTIAVIVFLPLVLGHVTFLQLKKKYSQEHFQKVIKPYLPAVSFWAMLAIIFASISMKSKMVLARPDLLGGILLALAVFYLINFTLSTVIARLFLNRADGVALIYGTVMRNLSIALGLAITAFGPQAALVVTLAFILQVQAAAWYGKMADRFGFFGKTPSDSLAVKQA
ncbi:sodium/bile acid symporter family protein [Heliomicrobium modesticaldum Ice1]|uniref:Sodium/bile acid symporter family protein n=1 Tax=Heliobacterium modesticaldum (strain ATCC 51547 / Ice1) TaxID=498761 RepID=B0TGN3_HELMI|nr:bile acid:sodium symporter [Heliomicrobium modesticaldum]ABZ83294.1 sodium/bile acid symporter family protein [Heliomicrobium modesticaldum Ice1]